MSIFRFLFFLPTTTGGCVSIIMTHRASAGQQQSFRLSLLFSFFFDRRCTREDDGQTRADIISLSIYLRYELQRGAQLLVFIYFSILYKRETHFGGVLGGGGGSCVSLYGSSVARGGGR